MKVLPVSFSFKSTKIKDKLEYNYPFLYTVDLARQQSNKEAHKFKIATSVLALAAVLITLFNLKGAKKFPADIVEITDLNKGLNKIKKYKGTVDELKSNVLYPLQAAAKGDKDITKTKKFKSGLVLTDKNGEDLLEMTSAFVEHVRELGIKTVDIPDFVTRTNAAGKTSRKYLKRNEKNKFVFVELQKAKKHFEETGKYTVINLGDLSKYTDLKIIKSQKSNFESKLMDLNSKNYPGIVWIGWTTKTKNVPLFLNELPVLITKLTK